MPFDFSPDYECPNCLESTQNESDYNPCFNKSGNNSSYSRSRKKSKPSSGVQCRSTRTQNDNKIDAVLNPSEEESYVQSSQNSPLNLNPEGITRKIRPLRELTVEELLRKFGDSWKFQPNPISVGLFRDQVVIKFRRALYYSGMWVTDVQGYRLEKHFSADYFKQNPGGLRRLVPWLKRELTAVYGDYGYTVKNILSTILHHMTQYNLESKSFIHLLEPYLQQHTQHFLHEFSSFVHSAYNMETYDQRAIYQCSASTRVKKKSIASVPVFLLPRDQALLASRHDTGQSENTHGYWNNKQRTLSGLRQFPNGNSSSKAFEIPLIHHETPSKTHAWIKDKRGSGDHKGAMPTSNMLLNWATPRERGPGSLSCKQNVQDRKTEGIERVPGHVLDLGKAETTTDTFRSPAVFHQEKQRKKSLKERRVLSLGQQMSFQKKELGKNKYSDASPQIFQKRLPRETSLINCKSRSCSSETALSSKRDGRKLDSFRKNKVKCRHSSQFSEVGSHSSRRIQRQSRSSTRRSKSWCVNLTKRSVSTGSSTPSLRGSHGSEYFTQNTCRKSSKEKNVQGYEPHNSRASSTTVQYMMLPSTTRKGPSILLKAKVLPKLEASVMAPHAHRLRHTDPQVNKK